MHSTNASGHHPIWIRIADSHRTLYHSLGEYIPERQWNPKAARVRKGHPVADELNGLIQDLLAKAQSEQIRLKRTGRRVTASAIKTVLVGPEEAPGDFLRYADSHVAALWERSQIREHRRQKAVIKKLRAYVGGPLLFADVDPAFLKAYETHLLSIGNQPSTVNSNFRVIRTILYASIRDGQFPQEKNPFFQFKLIRPNPPDRAKLTAEQILAIEDIDLGGRGPSAPLLARVRDYFLFSFYAAGIRFTDVAQMKCENVVEVVEDDGNRAFVVSYTMGKTGRRVAVRLHPNATSLVEAYLKGENGAPKDGAEYLFPILTGRDVSTPEKLVNASGSQNALVNKYLKHLAAAVEDAGTPMPAKLTFHIARHTWADLARKSGRDVYEISRSMAHSGLGITERYLANFEGEVIDAELPSIGTLAI